MPWWGWLVAFGLFSVNNLICFWVGRAAAEDAHADREETPRTWVNPKDEG